MPDNNFKQREGLLEKSRKDRDKALFSTTGKDTRPNGNVATGLLYTVSDNIKNYRGNMFSPIGMSYNQYVDKVYGEDGAIVNAMESMLNGVSTTYVLRSTQVSVVNDINPELALTGVITTNPHNREMSKIVNLKKAIMREDYDPVLGYGISDTDTRLGIVSNTMYSNALLYGANANTARGRGDARRLYPYLTPYLAEDYGNNLATFKRLSDILRVESSTGRVKDDLGSEVQVTDFNRVSGAENGNFRHLTQQIKNAQNANEGKNTIYTPQEGQRYVSVLETYEGVEIGGEKFDGFWGFTNEKVKNTSTQNNGNIHFVYNEGESSNSSRENTPVSFQTVSEGFNDDEYDTYVVGNNSKNNLLAKTRKLFEGGKLRTMISRFYSGSKGLDETNTSPFDSKYGLGHGRTLKKKTPTIDEGYENPYCRSWNYHHQYMKYKDAIRPFMKTEDEPYEIDEIQGRMGEFRSRIVKNGTDTSILSGEEYLKKNTVLGKNGLVRIGMYDTDPKNNIQNYMLSIENLAWKDFPKSIERNRKGPNGGRIMWFPPYGLDFQENVSVDWSQNSFIGRGEKVYTYANTDRTASLSFTLLIDHPSIVDTADFKADNSSDIDDKILRYFAGCADFEFRPTNNEGEGNNGPNEPLPTDKPQETTGQGSSISFPVFFPNNYSGNMNVTTSTQLEQNGPSDSDWWEYLLYGSDADKVTLQPFDSGSTASYRGYEMSDSGITTSIDSDDYIPACINESREAYGSFRKCNGDLDDMTRCFRYRVDFDLRQRYLNNSDSGNTYGSYSDMDSYHFNSNVSSFKSNDNTNQTDNFKDCDFSFAEFIAATDSGNTAVCAWAVNKGANPQNIEKISKILSDNTNFNVTIEGGATNQDSKNSNELARRRSLALRDLLYEKIGKERVNVVKYTRYVPTSGTNNLESSRSSNTKDAKLQRYAKVTIEYGMPTTTVAGNNADFNNPEVISANETNDNIAQNTATRSYMSDANGDKLFGYEYEYFKELSVTNPVIFKKIHDKFQYFDPAFHSMSPEGFNARLNFLHQCTRQGHTISASESDGRVRVMAATAGNLAFGRMPVCVLKIGDFINSRVIIQSMTIQYSDNGIQWDLNPDGAGVQPVFAKVTLNVVLLGGSALNGPVNRLQNAQTFNYYSNTGVYDPRADRIEYDKNGKGITYSHLYVPASEK